MIGGDWAQQHDSNPENGSVSRSFQYFYRTPKGCFLVAVGHSDDVLVEFRATDVFRWERCEVDANEAEDPYELIERVSHKLRELADASDGRPLAVRRRNPRRNVRTPPACCSTQALEPSPLLHRG